MKTLLIFSALIGFTLPEKLDRTYLPPPGSKFSGGSPGAIDVPLEFPKETYSSSQNNNFGRPEIAIGIDKIGSNISPEKYRDITSTVPSFQGNSYGFPTATTSNTFLQTNSYLPAEASTIEPNILINAKYPINNSINITTPGYFREKYLSLDHTGPNKEQMLNDINDILENQLPDNKISSQFVKNLSDETQHSINGDPNTITKINLYFGNVGTPGLTSTPAEIDHSLLSNNYDTTRSPLSSEPISQNEANFISSTPIQSSIISTAQTNKTNTSHSYHSRPEGIQEQDREAVILNYDNTITPDGYAYSFDTSNGIHADEKGTAINGVRAEGSYSYIGDDGQLYRVNYTADENGFRPHGAHLPTAPPIPDAILKVIEQAAADKANGIYDDGSYDDNKYGYKKYNPNIRLLKQYNKNRQGTNLNRNKSDNQLPHNRLGENLNKKNDSDEKNEQNYETKNQIQPYIKTYLVNGSVSEILPIDKSEQFKKNKEKNYINSNARNNVYNNNNIYNKILSSMPHLKDIEKEEKLMSIESYDETGYHYSKPQNEYTLKAADKLLNKFPETPNSIEIPAKYKKIVNNVSPIKTPSITLDDDIFEDHDGDDQSLDIPTKYHEDQNIILSNPTSRPFPILAKTEIVPGKTENRIHDFTIQFKQPDKSSSDDGYLYIKNGNSNNESEVPFLSSTEIGLSDITSTIPRLSKLSDSSLFQNQVPFSNPSLDQGKNPKTLTHSNRLDNYENNDDNDITDSGSTYSTPNMYGGIKDYILEHSTPKTYSEGFSGPEQAQKFDPLTGYYY